MYVDYKIPVCSGLPKAALEEIEILDKAYKENDVGTYMLHEDAVESYIKQAVEDGKITLQDLDSMFKRFGWR